MKLRVLGAALAAMLGCVSANTANATALPAKYWAGVKVLRNAEKGNTADDIFKFCQKENIPLHPVEPYFTGKNDFCVFAYTADQTDKAIRKTGYSTQDTMASLSKNWLQFEVYRSEGMGELLQPLYMLALVPEGQKFLIRKGVMRQGDVAGFNAIVAYEKQLTEQRNAKPSQDCIQSKIVELTPVAGQLAPQLAEQMCKKQVKY
ncbi:hypothetical protein ML405_19480 [Escherichia coli]|uniref:hypothetical protein n=1 Tax=Escherichia coli TaxID=562 RepID=UPI001F5B2523|nr:hypothetical protein [Escherichia coli]MCI3096645.1 hypothetical protein [Escherichia coli]